MKAADKKRIKAQQEARKVFTERMEKQWQDWWGVAHQPQPDCPTNSLAFKMWEDKCKMAMKRVESLGHAIQELDQLII